MTPRGTDDLDAGGPRTCRGPWTLDTPARSRARSSPKLPSMLVCVGFPQREKPRVGRMDSSPLQTRFTSTVPGLFFTERAGRLQTQALLLYRGTAANVRVWLGAHLYLLPLIAQRLCRCPKPRWPLRHRWEVIRHRGPEQGLGPQESLLPSLWRLRVSAAPPPAPGPAAGLSPPSPQRPHCLPATAKESWHCGHHPRNVLDSPVSA